MTLAAWKRIDRGLVPAAALVFALPVLLLLSTMVPAEMLRDAPLLAMVDVALSVVAFAGPPVGGGALGYLLTRRDPGKGRSMSVTIVLLAASAATGLYFLVFGFAPAIEVLYLYMIWAVYIVATACALIGAFYALRRRDRAPRA